MSAELSSISDVLTPLRVNHLNPPLLTSYRRHGPASGIEKSRGGPDCLPGYFAVRAVSGPSACLC